MLVYIKKTLWNELVFPFQDSDVPETLRSSCERDLIEQERVKKEKQDGKWQAPLPSLRQGSLGLC